MTENGMKRQKNKREKDTITSQKISSVLRHPSSFIIWVYLFWGMGICSAATYRVPHDVSSISAAVQQAVSGDTISVYPGTYTERIDFSGKYIVIQSTEGAEKTIIKGYGSDSVITVQNTPYRYGATPITISGFTIQSGVGSSGRGGGITLANNADAIVENCIIRYNTGQDGAGILIYESKPIVRNNQITGNTCSRYGAGIYVVSNSHATIINNTISSNAASGGTYTGGGAGGGGIYVDGNSSPAIVGNRFQSNTADHAGGAIMLRVGAESIVEENTISGNSAPFGGGIHLETEGSSPTILNNRIENNVASYSSRFAGSGFGGGISLFNKSTPLIQGNTITGNHGSEGGGGIVISEYANPDIYSNTISGNSTKAGSLDSGGGIYLANESSATICNNIISGNSSRAGGGISLLSFTSVTLVNNTLVANTVTAAGGGIYVQETDNPFTARNNIFAGNNDYQVFDTDGVGNYRYNCIQNSGNGMLYSSPTGVIKTASALNSAGGVQAEGNLDGDPGFVSPSGSDYHLASGSRCIDSGETSGAPVDDRDTMVRPYNWVTDIGSYEYAPDNKQKTPVYRFWRAPVNSHYWTASTQDKNNLLSAYPRGEWEYEGIVFYAFASAHADTVPMYIFYNSGQGSQFLTASDAEVTYLNSLPDTWEYWGIAWYLYPSGYPYESTSLYRLLGTMYDNRFYTFGLTELDYLIDTLYTMGWVYELEAGKLPN